MNNLSDKLLNIFQDLQEDKIPFERLGISYEEKAFFDILVKVCNDHGFPYADKKCLMLAKKMKELVDDKAPYEDWPTRDDMKNQLNMDLMILLYQNGYPPEWDEEIFEKVMAQAENFKKFSGNPFFNQIMSYINFSRMNPYLWLQKDRLPYLAAGTATLQSAGYRAVTDKAAG